MNEGDVVLTALPQADGKLKNRPAAALRKMPPFDDWLVCGITTQQHHEAEGFDDPIRPGHDDDAASGLKAPSLIRLGFLADPPAFDLNNPSCNTHLYYGRRRAIDSPPQPQDRACAECPGEAPAAVALRRRSPSARPVRGG